MFSVYYISPLRQTNPPLLRVGQNFFFPGYSINVALNPSEYLYNDLAAINILKNILRIFLEQMIHYFYINWTSRSLIYFYKHKCIWIISNTYRY